MNLWAIFRKMACSLVMGAATAQALAARLPPVQDGPRSLWEVEFLAIPLLVLVASLSGATARVFREDGQPDWSIPRKVRSITFDGFIGGWCAVFLVTFSYTRGLFEGVSPVLMGAFGGLLTQYIRDVLPTAAREFWQAWLSVWSRKPRNGGEAP